MNENELSNKIIGVAIKLHREIGPGLLESAYEAAFVQALQECGLQVKRQVEVPFTYRNTKLEVAYRIDILINDLVVIELKAVEELAPVHVD